MDCRQLLRSGYLELVVRTSCESVSSAMEWKESVTSAPAYALEEPGKGVHEGPWEKTGFSGVSGESQKSGRDPPWP